MPSCPIVKAKPRAWLKFVNLRPRNLNFSGSVDSSSKKRTWCVSNRFVRMTAGDLPRSSNESATGMSWDNKTPVWIVGIEPDELDDRFS